MEAPQSVQSPEPLRFLATNVKFPCGNTLLHQLVVDNSLPNKSSCGRYVNAVLRSMSDIPSSIANALNNGRKSALDLAVMKNNPEMVGKLLSCLANIDVDAKCRRPRSHLIEGDTALHLAADRGYLSVVRELLDHGAGIDAMNNIQETPLCYAVRSGHLDVVMFLVSKGAQLNLRRVTPLCYAIHSGNLEVIKYLLDSGAVLNCCHKCRAARSNDLAIAEILRESEASKYGRMEYSSFLNIFNLCANDEDGFFNTPLHLASLYGSVHIIRLLIEDGADVNARDRWGVSPLLRAVKWKHLECASFLMDCGASFQADELGWTPLHAAAHSGNAEIVRLLLDKGADVSARDRIGRTPFCVAKANIAPLLR